jgi:hypothetical protein
MSLKAAAIHHLGQPMPNVDHQASHDVHGIEHHHRDKDEKEYVRNRENTLPRP